MIEALTGIPAYALKRDTHGSILWRNQVPYLMKVLCALSLILYQKRGVEYDFRKRYQSATEVQVDLAPIADQLAATEPAYGPVIVAPGAEPERPIDIEAATDETNMLPVNWFAEPTQDQDG